MNRGRTQYSPHVPMGLSVANIVTGRETIVGYPDRQQLAMSGSIPLIEPLFGDEPVGAIGETEQNN